MRSMSRTMAAIAKAVSSLPPFPLGSPLPDMDGGGYRNRPCNNPKERLGGLHHTPVCMCGFAMGEHDTRPVVAMKEAAE